MSSHVITAGGERIELSDDQLEEACQVMVEFPVVAKGATAEQVAGMLVLYRRQLAELA